MCSCYNLTTVVNMKHPILFTVVSIIIFSCSGNKVPISERVVIAANKIKTCKVYKVVEKQSFGVAEADSTLIKELEYYSSGTLKRTTFYNTQKAVSWNWARATSKNRTTITKTDYYANGEKKELYRETIEDGNLISYEREQYRTDGTKRSSQEKGLSPFFKHERTIIYVNGNEIDVVDKFEKAKYDEFENIITTNTTFYDTFGGEYNSTCIRKEISENCYEFTCNNYGDIEITNECYDEYGLLLKTYNVTKQELENIHNYEYNALGKWILAYTHWGDYCSKTEYKYLNDSLLIEQLDYDCTGSDFDSPKFKLIRRVTNEYNEKGDKVRETKYMENGDLEYDLEYDIEYNSFGNPTVTSINNLGEFSEKIVKEYNDNQQMTLDGSFETSGEYVIDTYSYNSLGLLEKHVKEKSKDKEKIILVYKYIQ